MSCLVSVILALSTNYAEAELVTGHVDVPGNGATFLSKFCVDWFPNNAKTVGTVRIELDIDRPRWPKDTYLMLLDDESKSYPDASRGWNMMSCEEKLRHAKNVFTFEGDEGSHLVREQDIVEGRRSRFWYLGIADCSGSNIKVDFKVHWSNPLRGWRQEFSMEQQWVLQTTAVFLLIHVKVALIYSRYLVDIHWRAHPMTQMLTAAVWCVFFALFGLVLNYWYFAKYGSRIFALYLFSKLLEYTSKFFVMCNLMLIARGRGVSWSMSRNDLVWLGKTVAPLISACFALEMYGDFSESQKYTTGFIYDSGFGVLLIAIDILLYFVFATNWCATHRYETDPVKNMFYKVFGLMATAWFLALPVTGILGLVIAPHVRYQILWVVSRSVQALACVTLVVFWLQNQAKYADVACTSNVAAPKVIGSGLLKLSTGPLPAESQELGGSEMTEVSNDKTFLL